MFEKANLIVSANFAGWAIQVLVLLFVNFVEVLFCNVQILSLLCLTFEFLVAE
jgi:hypothetical protein